jgi:hypothetical protein
MIDISNELQRPAYKRFNEQSDKLAAQLKHQSAMA